MSDVTTYDLLLGHHYVRLNPYFLNVIRQLSGHYRIGLLLGDEPDLLEIKAPRVKGRKTDQLFVESCVAAGARLVHVTERTHARILLMALVSKDPAEDYQRLFRLNITYDRAFGLLNLFGTPVMPFFRSLNVERYYVEYKESARMGEQRYGYPRVFDDGVLFERNMRYSRYPAFPELNGKIDYMVAFPSSSQFVGDEGFKNKYYFLKNLHAFLQELPAGAKVVVKHHNVKDDHRYLVRFRLRNNRLLKMAADLAEGVARRVPVARKKLYSIAANCVYTIVLNSCPSLEELTPYHNFPLQLFLPAISRGIVGGYSASAFYALAENIPYYNCDPREAAQMSHLTLAGFCQVEPCGGKLSFDKSHFSMVSEVYRAADFIAELEAELRVPAPREERESL